MITKIDFSLSCPYTAARTDKGNDVGLQQHRIRSLPGLRLHTAITKLDRKPYFPFLKAAFPAGAEHSAFLPLTKYREKKLFTRCLCCHQIPMSRYLPVFICLRNMRSLKWFFFLVSNNANLTFLFLISPSGGGTRSRVFIPSSLQGKQHFLRRWSLWFAPAANTSQQLELPRQALPPASTAGTAIPHSTAFFQEKISTTHSLINPELEILSFHLPCPSSGTRGVRVECTLLGRNTFCPFEREFLLVESLGAFFIIFLSLEHLF